MIDPLAFDNVRGLGGSLPGATPNGFGGAQAEVGEDITGRSRRTGRQARFNDTDDVPRVKDATGEKVMESFALFLEK